MNYIKHLTKFFEMVSDDDRMLPNHIAIYMSLFKFWNKNRFKNSFRIDRIEVMRTSGIKSITTFTRTIKELHEWDYLEHNPSFNPFIGSVVSMYDLCTGLCTGSCTAPPSENVQVGEHVLYINNNKHSKQDTTPSKEEIFYFFKEKNVEEVDADKFFFHYEANGWVMGENIPMKNWKAAAQKWILNISKFRNPVSRNTNSVGQPGNLHVKQNKNYSEPL